MLTEYVDKRLSRDASCDAEGSTETSHLLGWKDFLISLVRAIIPSIYIIRFNPLNLCCSDFGPGGIAPAVTSRKVVKSDLTHMC